MIAGSEARPRHGHAAGGHLEWVEQGASEEVGVVLGVLLELFVLHDGLVYKESEARGHCDDASLPQGPGNDAGPEAEEAVLLQNADGPIEEAEAEPARVFVLAPYKLRHGSEGHH